MYNKSMHKLVRVTKAHLNDGIAYPALTYIDISP